MKEKEYREQVNNIINDKQLYQHFIRWLSLINTRYRNIMYMFSKGKSIGYISTDMEVSDNCVRYSLDKALGGFRMYMLVSNKGKSVEELGISDKIVSTLYNQRLYVIDDLVNKLNKRQHIRGLTEDTENSLRQVLLAKGYKIVYKPIVKEEDNTLWILIKNGKYRCSYGYSNRLSPNCIFRGKEKAKEIQSKYGGSLKGVEIVIKE